MGRAATAKKVKQAAVAEFLKLDFGCGPHKREGFQGVDSRPFVGVDQVVDLTQIPWPWPDNSVAEAYASHFIEHLNGCEAIHNGTSQKRYRKAPGAQ